jgi:hypothetical protein
MLPNCSLSANNAGYNSGSIRGVRQFRELADCIFEIPQLRSLENLAYVIHFFFFTFQAPCNPCWLLEFLNVRRNYVNVTIPTF